ncbi:uncharacterized protein B0T23DRAFT_404881 [Neurospora hispaniola]|uniref:Uncharacterized protein n=1 Tax=Neurospora hispaniola TaxID=588809 RepID=A0AAJ0MRQ1_9PEZI|nr:hypothetical protein B0T23DRAFT_404881 [Neurospora hispaniola]
MEQQRRISRARVEICAAPRGLLATVVLETSFQARARARSQKPRPETQTQPEKAESEILVLTDDQQRWRKRAVDKARGEGTRRSLKYGMVSDVCN